MRKSEGVVVCNVVTCCITEILKWEEEEEKKTSAEMNHKRMVANIQGCIAVISMNGL